jgi:hypothetical protein
LALDVFLSVEIELLVFCVLSVLFALGIELFVLCALNVADVVFVVILVTLVGVG